MHEPEVDQSEENEKILLDAELIEMIDVCAFRAALDNGHRFVAYCAKPEHAGRQMVAVGQRVAVSMSPFDMGRGRIIPQETRS